MRAIEWGTLFLILIEWPARGNAMQQKLEDDSIAELILDLSRSDRNEFPSKSPISDSSLSPQEINYQAITRELRH